MKLILSALIGLLVSSAGFCKDWQVKFPNATATYPDILVSEKGRLLINCEWINVNLPDLDCQGHEPYLASSLSISKYASEGDKTNAAKLVRVDVNSSYYSLLLSFPLDGLFMYRNYHAGDVVETDMVPNDQPVIYMKDYPSTHINSGLWVPLQVILEQFEIPFKVDQEQYTVQIDSNSYFHNFVANIRNSSLASARFESMHLKTRVLVDYPKGIRPYLKPFENPCPVRFNVFPPIDYLRLFIWPEGEAESFFCWAEGSVYYFEVEDGFANLKWVGKPIINTALKHLNGCAVPGALSTTLYTIGDTLERFFGGVFSQQWGQRPQITKRLAFYAHHTIAPKLAHTDAFPLDDLHTWGHIDPGGICKGELYNTNLYFGWEGYAEFGKVAEPGLRRRPFDEEVRSTKP